MAYGITDLVSFLLGTLFIVLLPGPNSLFVMTVASRQGVGAGYRGACGIFSGDFVLMILTSIGAASLLHSVPALFMVVKYLGGAYLSWTGINLLRAAWRGWHGHPAMAPASAQSGYAQHPFRTAFLISLMNPKAILFFVSFFIQFVDPNYAYPALTFTLLGLIVQACSALYLSALIFGGAHLAQHFRRHPRISASLTASAAMVFIGFAIKLFTANLG